MMIAETGRKEPYFLPNTAHKSEESSRILQKHIMMMDEATYETTYLAIGIAALVVVATLFLWKRDNDGGVPRVPSWIPYAGCAGEYFQSVYLFIEKHRAIYGGPFKATILGKTWYFITAQEDILQMYRAPDKTASLVLGAAAVGGSLMPHEAVDGKHASAFVNTISRRL